MSRRVVFAIASCLVLNAGIVGGIRSQDSAGRVFLPTPETVAIYEFNGFPELADGDALVNGTIVPDLSGGGLNATVEQSDGYFHVGPGDPSFDVPTGANRECDHPSTQFHTGHIAVNDDNDAFEMAPEDDFSVELYVNRETVAGAQNWGILAGTWHSRNLLDDSVGNPDNNGAWYGYGLIKNDKAGNPGAGGEWSWVLSPVVDGVPRIGFAQAPEQALFPFFDMADGRHYVALSVNRVDQTAISYLDGVEVGRLNLDSTWSFLTPGGYDHARFLLFNGEDDASRGAYRVSPAGTHLDAVRVQRKALTPEEVEESWGNMQVGLSSPAPTGAIRALLIASSSNVIVGQCVLLDGRGSSPGIGKTITKYEWRVGAAGQFEVGASTHEISFDAPNTIGLEVSLRVTNDAAETSTAKTVIKIKNPTVTARFGVKLEDREIPGKSIIVPVGSVLTLDGTLSSSDIPPGALQCPIASNLPVVAPAITEYRWDLDGKAATIEDTRPTFDTAPYNELGTFSINLQVRNALNILSQRTLTRVKVVDAAGNAEVFHNTPETLLRFELNELEPGPTPDGALYPDLSGNGLDLSISNPAGDSLVVEPGAVHLADDRALTYAQGGNGPRGTILNDGDLFEMGPDRDFTFEIYVRASDALAPQWGDVAGTFRARTDGSDASPRYGWGIIKSHLDQPGLPGYAWFTPNQTPDEVPVFFNLPAGELSYVACVVNRLETSSSVYINGKLASQRVDIDPAWSFATPDGFPHASFYLFTREQSDGELYNCPAGTSVDALRLQGSALTAAQVAANWEDICSGAGANPDTTPAPGAPRNLVATPGSAAVSLAWDAPDAGPAFDGYAVFRDGAKIADLNAAQRTHTDAGRANGTRYCYVVRAAQGARQGAPSNEACATPGGGPAFHRGDADDNGKLELTDAVRILNYLFTGGIVPACLDAADADDNGKLELTDAVRILGYLFLGALPPASPGPPPAACGADTTAEPIDLGCAAYTHC